MPSTAPHGKFNDEAECDLMFYLQEHNIFHIIDRCSRYGAGTELPDITMTSTLDSYHQRWRQFGLAKVLSSDREGAPNNDPQRQTLRQKALS
eukprot:2077862-Pyramimonas_sp.AAC.1